MAEDRHCRRHRSKRDLKCRKLRKKVRQEKDFTDIEQNIRLWRVLVDQRTNLRGMDGGALDAYFAKFWLSDAVWQFNVQPPFLGTAAILEAWSPGGSIIESTGWQRTVQSPLSIEFNKCRTTATAKGTLIIYENFINDGMTTGEYITASTEYNLIRKMGTWKVKTVTFIIDTFHTEQPGGYLIFPTDIIPPIKDKENSAQRLSFSIV